MRMRRDVLAEFWTVCLSERVSKSLIYIKHYQVITYAQILTGHCQAHGELATEAPGCPLHHHYYCPASELSDRALILYIYLLAMCDYTNSPHFIHNQYK